LPIIFKDYFHLEPSLGLGTTAGAYCFVGEKSRETATVIQQLTEKGMIILATANLSEFCGHKAGKCRTAGLPLEGKLDQHTIHRSRERKSLKTLRHVEDPHLVLRLEYPLVLPLSPWALKLAARLSIQPANQVSLP
jgi:hypothetical protein